MFPHLSPNPDDPQYNQYCRVKVLLHHLFHFVNMLCDRHGEQLLSWQELFEECSVLHAHQHDTLRSFEDENRVQKEEEDDDELIDPDVDRMEEADWQTWARDHPNTEIPSFTVDDLGRKPLNVGWNIHASCSRWNNVDKMASYLNEQKHDELIEDNIPESVDLESLMVEQHHIFNIYVETYGQILVDEGVRPQLFNIDGTAGCGKTYLIKAICKELWRLAGEHGHPDLIRVIALSGVAALNIFR